MRRRGLAAGVAACIAGVAVGAAGAAVGAAGAAVGAAGVAVGAAGVAARATPGTAQAWPEDLRVDAKRIEKRIMKLGTYGSNPEGGVSRLAYSDADLAGRKYIMGLMRDAGLEVRVDAAGNISGRRAGSDPALPVILFGSHIDSVPHGGNYDGDVGVIAAIECMQVLQDRNIITRHPLEAIVFTDEEGGLVGSRALIGDLTDEALAVMSHSGVTVREGIKALGGDPGDLESVARSPGSIKAFIELHIEQGAVLFEEKIDIGVVEGIVGIHWWEATIEGHANHAGTTPMNRRQDALLAAAHLILAVNQEVNEESGRHVGTVGRIKAEPGAPNVIAGRVTLSLELRDLSADKILSLFGKIRRAAQRIEKTTGTTIRFAPIDAASAPALTDERMRRIITDAAAELALSTKSMPSGAGHDAQDIALIAPTGLIFVPSVGGISHSPQEFTHPEDMTNGANVLLQTILRIDQGAL
jgi:N-carbamoyl-L-amino-acid hydrolase